MIQFVYEDWPLRSSLLGRHYGRTYSSYRTCLVQYRDDWEDTAEHELLHAADSIIQIYLGISLSVIFGVRDFDEQVIHGKHPDYEEYEYDAVWKKIAPYLNAATQKRYRLGYLSASKRLVVKLREYVAYLRNKVAEINAEGTQVDELEVRSPGTADDPSLYEAARSFLGTDASPSDIAPDELGCAESVSSIIRSVLPTFPIIPGTWTLCDRLRNHPSFVAVEEPLPGDIIISPTGEGSGSFSGHAGIVGSYGHIMSNDSATGKFEENYDLQSWRIRYAVEGGFPVHYFRLIK